MGYCEANMQDMPSLNAEMEMEFLFGRETPESQGVSPEAFRATQLGVARRRELIEALLARQGDLDEEVVH
jgi:hypothetical protein